MTETPAPTSSPPAPSRLRKRWVLGPLLFGVLGSTVTHGTAAIAILLHPSGAAAGGGEGGKLGAGDTTIDVSVAGPIATGADTVSAAESPPPPPTPLPTVTAHVDPPPPADSEEATEPPPPTDVTPPPDAPPPSPAAAASGGGAETTSGGKLAGPIANGGLFGGVGGDTIEGQRALLPAASTCKDPVAGRWEALKFNPARDEWVNFTVTIHRGVGGFLTGTILSHTWFGTAFDRVPPACHRGSFDMTVTMVGSGHDDGARGIRFGSSSYSLVAVKCWSPDQSYSPDNFSGTIDPARQEFQSVNNDGANDVNAPYVFRRTGCVDE